MKRRTFLQGLGMLGLGITAGRSFAELSFDSANVRFNPVSAASLPRYINIFLYGGPSELAGNLTNIPDISANSQNPYPASVLGNVTANGFWGNAGGNIMEALLASGDMSIYRTMNRIKEDSKAHGLSVTQNLVGNLNMQSPGIATTLAWIMSQNNPFAKPVEELLFPFVSFEGESSVFKSGELYIDSVLKPVALIPNLGTLTSRSPYARSQNVGSGILNDDPLNDLDIHSRLDTLANHTNSGNDLLKLNDSFGKRALYDQTIKDKLDVNVVDATISSYGLDPATLYLNNNFGNRMKAAVSLALANPETVFISMGSGGLGGWDDHSQAITNYANRMSNLMQAIQAGITHMNAASANGVNHAGNIIINVYGDFGRNVNLNDSLGWDHGNNQNLYTFGGKGISGRSLGKIVGRTERIGNSGVNRQFTTPTATSYQFEPFALASTMYRHFGVTNPELITGELPINESAPAEPLV